MYFFYDLILRVIYFVSLSPQIYYVNVDELKKKGGKDYVQHEY